VTLLCDLRKSNGFVVASIRDATNTAEDFYRCLAALLRDGDIRKGDIVILDNASIHHAWENEDDLRQLFRQHGAKIIFLPVYSPELNPCELVFAQSKSYIYHHRGDLPFVHEIAKSFSQVRLENVLAFYRHCILNVTSPQTNI
jgi:transposase